MESLPTIDDLNSEPTFQELSKAIAEMAFWKKIPGSDGILANLFCQCKPCLLQLLHDILVKFWRVAKVPQDIRDAKIIIL